MVAYNERLFDDIATSAIMEGAIVRMAEKAGEMQRKYNMFRREEITEEIEVIMLSSDALNKPTHSVGRPAEA